MTAAARFPRECSIGWSIEDRIYTRVCIVCDFVELGFTDSKDAFVLAAPEILLFVFENAVDDVGRKSGAIRDKFIATETIETATVCSDP